MDGEITISGRQRNLLYGPTLDFLSVANDAYVAALAGRYEEADRLGRQTRDELLLVFDGLGWERRADDEVIGLVTPAPIVRRVVGRILDGANHEVFEGTRGEIRKLERETEELRSACEEVLAALPVEAATTRKRSRSSDD